MKKTFLFLIAAFAVLASAFADDIPYRQQRREIFRQLPINEQSIVFLGNSITDFGLWSEFFGSNPYIVNRGIQGIESPEVLDNLALIGSGHPAKVFLMIGINDFNTPGRVVPNIRRMIGVLREKSPKTTIYVQSILPCNLAARATVPPTLNPQIKDLCDELGVTYIDIYGAMTQITGNTTMPANMTDDSLHPNVFGYRIWCNLIQDYVGTPCTIDQTATTANKPLSRAIYKSLLTEYQLVPVNDGDILHVGDYQVMTGEWGELMGTPKFKNRGLGGGYGWSMTLSEFNSCYTCLIKGNPSKIFFQCGKRQLDDKPTDVQSIFNQYKTAVTNMRNTAPNADIYLESIIPNADASVNTTSIIPFNALIKAYVEADKSGKLHFVDVYAALEEGGILATRYQGANTAQSRGINGRGYTRWANTLAEFVPEAKPVHDMTDAEFTASEANWESLLKEWRDAIPPLPDTRVRPIVSTAEAMHYYNIISSRGTKYVGYNSTNNQTLSTVTASNAADQAWYFTENADGSYNIQSAVDESYIQPGTGGSSSTMTTSASKPSAGWKLGDCNDENFFIITSGSSQMNVNNTSQILYNWGGGTNVSDGGCFFRLEEVELKEPTYDYVGVEPGKTYTITNVQQNGDTRVLYADGGELCIGDKGAEATTYGAKAHFIVEGHSGKVSFQNEATQEYLIWRGNGGGYNGDKGMLAEYAEPWCVWTVVNALAKEDHYFFYSTRSSVNNVGSLVIMSGTGKFDAYGNTQGWSDRFSNVYKFTEVPTTGISTLTGTSSKSAPAYDLQGRLVNNNIKGITLRAGQKVMR